MPNLVVDKTFPNWIVAVGWVAICGQTLSETTLGSTSRKVGFEWVFYVMQLTYLIVSNKLWNCSTVYTKKEILLHDCQDNKLLCN